MRHAGRILFTSLLVSAGVGGCSSGGTGDSSPMSPGGGAGAASSGGAANFAGASSGLAGAGAAGSGAASAAGSSVGGTSSTGTAGSSGAASGGTSGSPGAATAGSAGSDRGGASAAGSGAGGAGAGGSGGSVTNTGGSGGSVNQGSLPNVTIHLAGDSTMSNYAASTTQEGWGQELGQFFISKVSIDNQALPGANVQTFYSSRWKTLIANTKAGDFVMAAFGTNDSGTTHGPVSTADFGAEFTQMASEVAAKKATFILTTPSPLQVWVNAKETNARLQPYCDVLIALGKSQNLLVDDLNARGVEYYNMIGETAAAALEFNGDKAHFDKQGAVAMAQLAAKELTRIGSPLAAYLK
jgi:lysophospholipase L1-like esterase